MALPSILTVTPNSGSEAGQSPIQIVGANFVVNYGTTTVYVGGVAATGVTVVTPTILNCVVPTHAVGTVDIQVINPDGQTAILRNAYTYEELPQTNYWKPDVTEAIEEAFERCGIEVRTGYQYRTAVRSMNIMLVDWANRGYNMWSVVQDTIPLNANQIEYDLPLDTIDVIEQVIRQYPDQGSQQIDLQISRISMPTYATIPNKLTTGRPIQIYYDRLTPIPKAKIWPAPNVSGYFLTYWRLARMAKAGEAGYDSFETTIPYRFYPAFISGLAYHLALKEPKAADRIQMLKAMYDEDFQRAANEDRERAPVRFVPRVGYLGGYGGY